MFEYFIKTKSYRFIHTNKVTNTMIMLDTTNPLIKLFLVNRFETLDVNIFPYCLIEDLFVRLCSADSIVFVVYSIRGRSCLSILSQISNKD